MEKRNMTALPKMILVSALLALATPSLADDTHHANDEATSPIAVTSAGSDEPLDMTGPDMMSGDMMGSALMSMMSPMKTMMMRIMSPKHIEGRLAFLKTELAITEAQRPMWDAFAEALRANARDTAAMMKELRGEMKPSQAASSTGLLHQIDLHERMLAARLEALRRMKAALEPLYAVLDDRQKRTADELLAPSPMGFM
jgi:hypothetical protein